MTTVESAGNEKVDEVIQALTDELGGRARPSTHKDDNTVWAAGLTKSIGDVAGCVLAVTDQDDRYLLRDVLAAHVAPGSIVVTDQDDRYLLRDALIEVAVVCVVWLERITGLTTSEVTTQIKTIVPRLAPVDADGPQPKATGRIPVACLSTHNRTAAHRQEPDHRVSGARIEMGYRTTSDHPKAAKRHLTMRLRFHTVVECGPDRIQLGATAARHTAHVAIAEVVRALVVQSVQDWMQTWDKLQISNPDPGRCVEDSLTGPARAIWVHAGWAAVSTLMTVDVFGLDDYIVVEPDSDVTRFEFCPTLTASITPQKQTR